MNFTQQRLMMVKKQLEARGLTDPKVLFAMSSVPREKFVPIDIRPLSYQDGPLPIDCGQTISQPYIVAYMAEVLELKPEDVVLEVGTGSGYNAAVLSKLCKLVYTLEIHSTLAKDAAQLFAENNFDNVIVKQGDGHLGWPQKGPFNAIILTAAPSEIPNKLLEQLAENGRMIAPVGEDTQHLYLWKKIQGKLHKELLIPVRFVPMVHSIDGQNASAH
jgi:protein-L-isoaspartate(D-aspartate) O-methyltransferase